MSVHLSQTHQGVRGSAAQRRAPSKASTKTLGSSPKRLQCVTQIGRKVICKSKQNKFTRQLKTPAQIRYMTQLYETHGKDCEQRVSNAACHATGLKWAQIYKWLYDHHQQKLNNENFMSGKPARVFNI